MKYLYVDDEMNALDEPKKGEQYYARIGNAEFVDVIKGSETCLRAFDSEALEKFIRNAYHRAPYIKVAKVLE